MPNIRESAAAHTLENLPTQDISTEVLIEKYAKNGETSVEAVTRLAVGSVSACAQALAQVGDVRRSSAPP